MRPTEILSSEHRVIERVLDCLAVLAERARGGAFERPRAEQALEVLVTFADRCHHGKEEDLLFAWMARRGMPTHVGPIAVMLDEHRQGRAHIASMRAACAAGEGAAFAAAAGQYVELLRDHIAKEDGVLFPMAESMLDDPAREELLAAFRAFEHGDVGPGVHERMLAGVDDLAAHLGVVTPAGGGHAATSHGCCGHGGCG